MKRLLDMVLRHPKAVLLAVLLAAAVGLRVVPRLAVDVFPDISVPRVTLQTEAGGYTAEEVEALVTIPLETAMSGIPGLTSVRSSSSGGLSFVWLDFDWSADLTRARFDVFERLSRVRESLPAGVETEIAPIVSVTGEIMLVALTVGEDGAQGTARPTGLELREMAEYDLRQRLLGVPGIGEVAVIGGRLPEYRVAVEPHVLASQGLSVSDVIEGARDTRTRSSAGYLANVDGEEIPLRQVARADSLGQLRESAIPLAAGSVRLGDVAEVTLAGAPRRGSASFNGREAVVLSVQKSPGGNTLVLTKELESVLSGFAATVKDRGVEVHTEAYRQADFIAASIKGGGEVVRDAAIVVALVLLVTLLEWRTLLVVLLTMPLSVLLGLALFPMLGLGVNVMTLGGFAVAAGDIVDGAIIFADAIRRRLPLSSVAPGVLFSTLIVAIVFVPLLLLDGLEGCFFRPLALAYLGVFGASLVVAFLAVPALGRVVGMGGAVPPEPRPSGRRSRRPCVSPAAGNGEGLEMPRARRTAVRGGAERVYGFFLRVALHVPALVVLLALGLAVWAGALAKDFGSSFLPPFREDSFNVALSLPPGASLAESERVAEACVPEIASIPGVLSVTRRTGRAERDQHAEPVSSSEYVVRVDLNGDPDGVRTQIRERLGSIPGCSLLVGYPIAHRISAVLSGTETEIAINVFGEDPEVLRDVVRRMKVALDGIPGVSDVRANREVMVRTLKIEYDMDALREAGLTLREVGEQVSAAFYGVEVGEVRSGVRRRAVVVRLAGEESEATAETVKALLLTSRNGRCVRLDEVAQVVPDDASNLMLREGGHRKALISCNASEGTNTGDLVARLREVLAPIAASAGCTVTFTGSNQARESAAKRLTVLGVVLAAVIVLILFCALKGVRAVILALVNVPLGLIGGILAVKIADPVLSVSSLVGFITVIGFVIRNGLLLLNRYQDRLAEGATLEEAIRDGSCERVVPIVMTSLTTVLGLVPIMLAGAKPGGELLAPLAVVQFGGILGATLLNLIVLPAATRLVGLSSVPRCVLARGVGKSLPLALPLLALFAGCQSYVPAPIDWQSEVARPVATRIEIASLEQAGQLAVIGNRELNAKRQKAAVSDRVAKEMGWWNDPELDCDYLRIVNPDKYPWIGGVSLAFTIPLSGVPGLEAKAAELYAEADRAEIRAAERETASAARMALVTLAARRETAARLCAELEDVREIIALSNAVRLAAAGEVTTADLSAARRRVHARQHALASATREIAAAETALRELLGLDPRTELVVSSHELHVDHTHEHADVADPLSLVAHPRVQAALARLAGDEASLKAEIRRQYPDLKLGPSYSYEDGNSRAGFVAGITLPLWNRNRKGIAEATGTRNASRQAAVDAWFDVYRNLASACAALDALESHEEPPQTDRKTAESLLAAGEIGPLDYLALCDEILESELSEIERRQAMCLAVEDIRRWTVVSLVVGTMGKDQFTR